MRSQFEGMLRRLAKLERRLYPCWGVIAEVDLDGTAEGNVHRITPGFRVDIQRLGIRRSVWCDRIRTAPCGDGWGEWGEPDVGQKGLVGFIDVTEHYPFIMGFIWAPSAKEPYGIPPEVGANVRTIRDAAGNLIVMDRTDNATRIMIRSADGHEIQLTDGETREIRLQSVDGKRLRLLDSGQDHFLLEHESGARLTLDADGDIALNARDIVIEGGRNIEIRAAETLGLIGEQAVAIKSDGDLTLTVHGTVNGTVGNLDLEVEDDATLTVGGNVKVIAGGDIQAEAAGKVNLLATGQEASLLAGVLTSMTQRVCPVFGIPLGTSEGVEATP